MLAHLSEIESRNAIVRIRLLPRSAEPRRRERSRSEWFRAIYDTRARKNVGEKKEKSP